MIDILKRCSRGEKKIIVEHIGVSKYMVESVIEEQNESCESEKPITI